MLNTLSKGQTLTAAQKKEKIEKMRLYHQTILEHFNVPDKDFNVKVAFTYRDEKVIGVFPSEFNKKNGFYFEFVDSRLDPTDPQRKLWMLQYRENYEDVYNLLPSGSYAVPLSDIEEVVIKRNIPTINLDYGPKNFDEAFDTDVTEENDDENHTKMTIRDLAAILWQRPVSKKNWLNKLVEETLLDQNVNL